MNSANEKVNRLATISNELAQSYSKNIEDFVDKGDITCVEIRSFSVFFLVHCAAESLHANQDSEATFSETSPPTDLKSWLDISDHVRENLLNWL